LSVTLLARRIRARSHQSGPLRPSMHKESGCSTCSEDDLNHIHPNLRPLPPDTGEHFLSVYLEEQLKRNQSLVEDKISHQSQCEKCAKNPELVAHERMEVITTTVAQDPSDLDLTIVLGVDSSASPARTWFFPGHPVRRRGTQLRRYHTQSSL
jgi:hypothetical protein